MLGASLAGHHGDLGGLLLGTLSAPTPSYHVTVVEEHHHHPSIKQESAPVVAQTPTPPPIWTDKAAPSPWDGAGAAQRLESLRQKIVLTEEELHARGASGSRTLASATSGTYKTNSTFLPT
jgi:hypothetical protein